MASLSGSLRAIHAVVFTFEARKQQGRARLWHDHRTESLALYGWYCAGACIRYFTVAGLIYWLLVPVQDCYGGSSKEYWWPKMQCLVAAFREWDCERLLDTEVHES